MSQSIHLAVLRALGHKRSRSQGRREGIRERERLIPGTIVSHTYVPRMYVTLTRCR